MVLFKLQWNKTIKVEMDDCPLAVGSTFCRKIGDLPQKNRGIITLKIRCKDRLVVLVNFC